MSFVFFINTYFIKIIHLLGGAALDLKAVEPKSCRWVTDMTWLNLVALSKLKEFKEILSKVIILSKKKRKNQ